MSRLQRKTPLARGTTPMKRTELRPVSKKRQRLNRERSKVVAQIRLERGPRCERCGRTVADARELHPHELRTRGQGGSLTDPANIRLVCPDCHMDIHNHPAESYATGWLIRARQ
jgi:5-methylcytosine-specific restriction endonuclease McrA